MTVVRRDGKPGRRTVLRSAGAGVAAVLCLGAGFGCGQAAIRPQSQAAPARSVRPGAPIGTVAEVNEGNTFAADKLNAGVNVPGLERSPLARTTWNGWKLPAGKGPDAPAQTAPAPLAVAGGPAPAVRQEPAALPPTADAGRGEPAVDALLSAGRATRIAPPMRQAQTAPLRVEDALATAVREAKVAPPAPPESPVLADLPAPVEVTTPSADTPEAQLPGPVEAAVTPNPAPTDPSSALAPAETLETSVALPPMAAEPAAELASETSALDALEKASRTSRIEPPRPAGADLPVPASTPELPPLPPMDGPVVPSNVAPTPSLLPPDPKVKEASRGPRIPPPSKPGTPPLPLDPTIPLPDLPR